MKNASKMFESYPYVAKNIRQVEMIQRRAARWAFGRYDRLNGVTDMLSEISRAQAI